MTSVRSKTSRNGFKRRAVAGGNEDSFTERTQRGLLLEQEVHQGTVRKSASCGVRKFLAQVSELVADVVNVERGLWARNGN